jgi:hypothetical protein
MQIYKILDGGREEKALFKTVTLEIKTRTESM